MSTIRYITAMALGLLGLQVHAGDAVNGNPDWEVIESSNRMVVQVPAITTHHLLDRVRELRGSLLARQEALSKTVEETTLDTADILISIILPGGLAYASYLKLSHDRAQDELASVSKELSDLSRPLMMLRAENGEISVASLNYSGSSGR